MKRPAWMILTTGLVDGYELTKSPTRVRKAKEAGQTVIELFDSGELALDALSDDGRYDVFRKYCTHCGAKDPDCQCWNDE